ncbi:hypothetical protein TBK1r_35280 [Stieleria magnilauensis]|uniref:Uncharacterized protein n=1 Tax=Stieleria magnilauensis TaxID=2527963 RepID=A0ABX5XRE3_9BACT|nr:hypothetical protein TBK1r_35280 [Planctomycetes bacterium TBK1r]
MLHSVARTGSQRIPANPGKNQRPSDVTAHEVAQAQRADRVLAGPVRARTQMHLRRRPGRPTQYAAGRGRSMDSVARPGLFQQRMSSIRRLAPPADTVSARRASPGHYACSNRCHFLHIVHFSNQLAAVHQRCAGNSASISWVHFQYPKPLDSQGSPRRVVARFGLSIKEKHRRPHDASHGGVMRLRITRWARRDQDGERIKTPTTCGQ